MPRLDAGSDTLTSLLLGRLIEVVAKCTYAEFVRGRILDVVQCNWCHFVRGLRRCQPTKKTAAFSFLESIGALAGNSFRARGPTGTILGTVVFS